MRISPNNNMLYDMAFGASKKKAKSPNLTTLAKEVAPLGPSGTSSNRQIVFEPFREVYGGKNGGRIKFHAIVVDTITGTKTSSTGQSPARALERVKKAMIRLGRI